MMKLLQKEMVELVVLASKSIIKYNKDDEVIVVYDMMKECCKNENLSIHTIHKHNKNNRFKDGTYFEIQEYIPKITIINCDNCGKEFKCQSFRIEKHKHLFCSKKCESEYKKSQSELNRTCIICDKKFHTKPSYEAQCCSKECDRIARKQKMSGNANHQYGLLGNKNPTWKSDEKISHYGYKLIRTLNHPFKNCDGFVFEHRLIAEKYLLNDENSIVIDGKKYLKKDYTVHHIDFNRLNNDKTNLVVMTKGEHTSLHFKLRRDDQALTDYCNTHSLDINTIKNRI